MVSINDNLGVCVFVFVCDDGYLDVSCNECKGSHGSSGDGGTFMRFNEKLLDNCT